MDIEIITFHGSTVYFQYNKFKIVPVEPEEKQEDEYEFI